MWVWREALMFGVPLWFSMVHNERPTNTASLPTPKNGHLSTEILGNYLSCIFLSRKIYFSFLQILLIVCIRGSQPYQGCDHLIQLLMLWSLPNHKIILLLVRNCHFATIMKHKGNIWYAGYLTYGTQGIATHREPLVNVNSSIKLQRLLATKNSLELEEKKKGLCDR